MVSARLEKLANMLMCIQFVQDVRFGVLTAVNIEITISWDVTPCSLDDRYKLSEGVAFIFRIPHSITLRKTELSFSSFCQFSLYKSNTELKADETQQQVCIFFI
jgi:hypothetical protein